MPALLFTVSEEEGEVKVWGSHISIIFDVFYPGSEQNQLGEVQKTSKYFLTPRVMLKSGKINNFVNFTLIEIKVFFTLQIKYNPFPNKDL